MNMELLIKMLMKMLGINDEHVRDVVAKGQEIVLDGKAKIDNIDARLARIEAALGIGNHEPSLRIEHGGSNHETDNQRATG